MVYVYIIQKDIQLCCLSNQYTLLVSSFHNGLSPHLKLIQLFYFILFYLVEHDICYQRLNFVDEFIKPCIFNLTSESLKIDSVSFQKMLRVLRVKLNNIIYCQLWKINIYVYGLELSLYQVPSLFLSFSRSFLYLELNRIPVTMAIFIYQTAE